MPRYRAKNLLFIDGDRLVFPGEEFTSDIEPGKNWEPLDAQASKAVAAMLAARGAAIEKAESTGIGQRNDHAASIEIPADWPSLSKPKRRALAMKIGAQPTCTAVEADSFIEAELGRRAQRAA